MQQKLLQSFCPRPALLPRELLCSLARGYYTRTGPETLARIHERLVASGPEAEGQERTKGEVRGWVRRVRSSKNIVFADVVDGSSNRPLQAIFVRGDNGLDVSEVRQGAALRLEGEYVWRTQKKAKAEAAKDYEMEVKKCEVVGSSDAETFPMQPKLHTSQFLRTIPHLRPRLPFAASILRLRSCAVASLTDFFAKQGYVQTHPPILTSSDCEGAGEVFTVSPAKKPEESEHFFGAQKYLTVSTQLHLEALAQAVPAVWSLSPAFRAEESETGRHMSEFYMLEAEMAFVNDLDEVMDVVEAMLGSMVTALTSSSGADWLSRESWEKPVDQFASMMELSDKDETSRRWRGMAGSESTKWPRITYAEAIQLLSEASTTFKHKPEWGLPLQTEHELYIAEAVGRTNSESRPVFITRYPRDTKAFYMLETEDTSPGRETVECFDLVVPAMGELVGGSLREHRLGALMKSMERCGIPVPDAQAGDRVTDGLGWYLDLRRWGCPPHGGFGLGFDRLLAYLTTVPNIKDVAAFPRWAGRCNC